MKYQTWEDMVAAQAAAFADLCAQNARLTELADKCDNGYNDLTEAEADELFALWDEVESNPFFARRCELEREEMEAQERPDSEEEEPNSWDPLEHESYVDLYGPWWE